ncbi:MAG: Glu-tRNA(Gln) amidotransferase subunit GatD [Thermoplasmatales archaeon]
MQQVVKSFFLNRKCLSATISKESICMGVEKGMESGDVVEVIWKGMRLTGTFISRDENITVIKLNNGYNLSLDNNNITAISLIKKYKESFREMRIESGKGKTVHLIGTGGTIASYVDYETGAVKPLKTAQEVLYANPALAEEANIEAEIAFNLFSEDMLPENWVMIARKIYDSMSDGSGVVVTHGTDTMTYTTSAISFLIENPLKPIVFTASQRSSDRPSSDAYLNLLGAVKVAQSPINEVTIVMHSSIGDDRLTILSGVRARKMHTSRRDAFRSVNSDPLGYIDEKMEIHWKKNIEPKKGEMKIYERISNRVVLLYYYPGMSEEQVHRTLDGSEGAIVMGTGLGHVSNRLVSVFREYVSGGNVMGMTSQCLYGAVNMNVYSTGRELLKAGVIPLGDMLPEVAFTKLSFLLGNFDADYAKKLMPVNLRGELSERRTG